MSDKRRDVPWWSGICPFPGNLLVFRLTSMEYFWLPPRALKVPTKGRQKKKKSSWEKGFPGPVFGLCLARVSRKNICIVTFIVLDIRLLLLLHFNITVTQKKIVSITSTKFSTDYICTCLYAVFYCVFHFLHFGVRLCH